MDFRGKKVLVAGMAKSGIASARTLSGLGAVVTAYDSKGAENFSGIIGNLGSQVEYKFNVDPNDLVSDQDIIVLSPGISMNKDFALKAKANGAEVIGEIELGYRLCKAPIVAITGTNGKTTTTALTGEIFKRTGRNSFVLGNIGIPIVEQALNMTEDDIVIAEVAGFQLESTKFFHPVSCAFLNISEDHLDRFGTMEAYIASKTKIFANQTQEDFATLNFDDPVVSQLGKLTKARKLFFSVKNQVEQGAFLRNNKIYYRFNGKEQFILNPDEIYIPGKHNLQNALAAICAALPIMNDVEAVRSGLREFKGVEHRLEFVCEKQGVRYINDSKGTNPDSTIQAVKAMRAPTILMLGGSNKNSDYLPVFRAFGEEIIKVIALGQTREQILRDARKAEYENITVCDGSFEEAVLLARDSAKSGDNVLLSPACASYDMFSNFEERGKVFKEIVYAF